MNDATLRDLVEQLQQPRVKWTCVAFAVVILVRMKLYLFALALPVMAFYYSPNLEGSEESPEREEKRSPAQQVPDFDQDEDELDGDFDRGPIQQPMDDQEEGDTDPYDQSFWGAGDSKPHPTPTGGAKPAAKKSSMGEDSEELPWSKPSPSRPEPTFKAAPWDEEPVVGIGDDLDSFPSDVLPGKSLGGSMDFGSAGPDMSDSFDFLGHGKDDDSDLLGFGGGDGGMGRNKGKGKGKKGDKNGGKGEKGPQEADPKQVFVAGVADMIEDEIRSVFEEVGDIDRLKVLRQPDGQSKGVCFITFRTEDQANRAIALSGKDCGGKNLVVRHAHGAGQTKGDGKGESRGKGDRSHLHGDSMSSRQGAPDLGGSGRFGAAFGEDHRGGGGGPPREGGKGGRGKGGGGGRGGGGGFGRDRADLDDALEQALAEVPGPVRVSDFDFPCRRFLAELRNRDRVDGSTRFQDALDMVSKYTSARDRSSVRKWPAYIFMLLQKFDSSIWHELQEKDAERRSHRDDNMRPRRPAAHDDD